MSSLPIIVSSRSRTRRRPPSPVVPPSEREYVEPTDDDVLRGRGGRTNTHPGNQRLLEFVRPLEASYALLKRGQKGRLSQDVVDTVHSWGGRFLEREVDDHGNERHYLMNQAGAIRLVAQKFRDEPGKRKRNRMVGMKTAKRARRKNKDEVEDEISSVESTEPDDDESWTATVEPLGPAILSTEPALTDPDAFSDLSPIQIVSPAHSVDDLQLEPLSDEELELEDFALNEDEVTELLSDPCAWGNNFPAGLIADPAFFFTDDWLMDMFLDGDDLFDFIS